MRIMRKKGQKPRVTVSCKISLGNYESLGVSVEGASWQECKAVMKETLEQFGKDEVTRELIKVYVRRVIGS